MTENLVRESVRARMTDLAAVMGVPVPGGPPPAPMGARGTYPVFIPLGGADPRPALEIPGVELVRGGVLTTWDASATVARLLQAAAPEVPTWDGPMPGLARYRALRLNERTKGYQKEDILFLARRAAAILAEPMRSGKSLMALAASILVDSRKTIIVCPAVARLGWADEIQTWTGEAALLLCGRGGREARLRCLTCWGTGLVPTPALTPEGAPVIVECGDCRQRNGQSYGYKIYDVPELVPLPKRDVTGTILWANVGKVACPKHPEVVALATGVSKAAAGPRMVCGRCKQELLDAVDQARFVIVNYELLVRQATKSGAGKIGVRDDLAGWVETLQGFDFDVLIGDEAHMLRGWSTTRARQGERRNDRLFELVGRDRIPRVWLLTGTPFYGFVRDIFWPLEIASGGLWGGQSNLKGKRFMERYCEGHKGRYGYEAKGRSIYAEAELLPRLSHLMIKRSREQLFADTPPVRRLVKHLELEGLTPFFSGRRGRDGIEHAIVAANDAKREALLETFLNELAEGNKIIVFCFHKVSTKKTFVALDKAIHSGAFKARMTQVNARAWMATGQDQNQGGSDALALAGAGTGRNRRARGGVSAEVVELTEAQRKNWAQSADNRHALAKTFREHVGAGVLVATIEALPVAISLRGASSVHFLDLHWSPGAIAQAEARPWYPEVVDLTTVFYVATKSVDDYIEAEVLPKVETLAKIGQESGMAEMLQAFSREKEEATIEAIHARHTAHLRAAGLDVAQGLEG